MMVLVIFYFSTWKCFIIWPLFFCPFYVTTDIAKILKNGYMEKTKNKKLCFLRMNDIQNSKCDQKLEEGEKNHACDRDPIKKAGRYGWFRTNCMSPHCFRLCSHRIKTNKTFSLTVCIVKSNESSSKCYELSWKILSKLYHKAEKARLSKVSLPSWKLGYHMNAGMITWL